MTNSTINIAGAGIVGLTLSMYLAKRGYNVNIYEKRPDYHDNSNAYQFGRNLSLDISERGLRSLQEICDLKELTNFCVPMESRIVHSLTGEVIEIKYSQDPKNKIYTISREKLYLYLLNLASVNPNINIYYQYKCCDFDTKNDEIEVHDIAQNKMFKIKSKILIACDGANSVFQKKIESQLECFFIKRTLEQHYKELSIPKITGAECLKHKAMHVWPRGNFMLMAQPNYDGSFTAGLFLKKKGENSFDAVTNKNIKSFFKEYFPDVYPFMSNLETDFERNSISVVQSISHGYWELDNKLLLMGDAAHSMTPFFGQGINASLENCKILNQCLDKYHEQWSKAIPGFVAYRLNSLNAINLLSWDNYAELHQPDLQSKTYFKKQLEQLLMKRYPNIYKSYHNLVCFDTVSYQYIYNFIKPAQQNLLEKIYESFKVLSDIKWKLIDTLMEEYADRLKSTID